MITFLLFYFGIYQIKKLNSVNDATFIQTITTNFYKEEVITIITLLHSGCIEFDSNNDFPVFRIDLNKTKEIYPKLSIPEKGYYTSYEIDFNLLNNLDDVGLFQDKKLIRLQDAHQTFAWYLNATISNEAIIAYFEWLDKYPENSFVFSKLKQLHTRFEALS